MVEDRQRIVLLIQNLQPRLRSIRCFFPSGLSKGIHIRRCDGIVSTTASEIDTQTPKGAPLLENWQHFAARKGRQSIQVGAAGKS